MFSAGSGVRGGIFREQRSLKHCTDWDSFEAFPCPQKGDPPLKHLQALGSPPGTISKTFSSSCCLCTCLPPVALTWRCLKLLPLISPPTTASDVQSLLDAGEDGCTQPWALRGGTEQPWQQPEARKSVSAASPWWLGEPWNFNLHHGATAEFPWHVSGGCPGARAPADPHPALPREPLLGALCREHQGLAQGFPIGFLQLCCSHSQAGCPN